MRRTLLAIVLIAAALAAGCAANTEDPREFTVTNASALAEQGNVTEPFTLIVHVRREADAGPAVEDAGVVFFTSTTRPSDWLANATHTDHDALAAATTDEDGLVFAQLGPDQTVNVAVGGVDGMTTELRSGVVLGAPGDQGHVTVVLYRDTITWAASGTVDAGRSIASLGSDVEGPESIATPLAFHEDAAINAAYLERLAHVGLALEWNNTQTSWADLAVGLAPTGAPAALEADERDEGPLDATNAERLDATADQLAPMRDAYTAAGGLDVVTRIDRAGAVEELQYAIRATAHFEGTDFVVNV